MCYGSGRGCPREGVTACRLNKTRLYGLRRSKSYVCQNNKNLFSQMLSKNKKIYLAKTLKKIVTPILNNNKKFIF